MLEGYQTRERTLKILLVDPRGVLKPPPLPEGVEVVVASVDDVGDRLEEGDFNIVIVPEEFYDTLRGVPGKPTVMVLPEGNQKEAFLNLLRAVEVFGKKVLKDESRFRDLFLNVPVGLYRTTPEGRVIDANPELLRILGFERVEDVIRKSVDEFYLNPQDRREFLKRLLEEGRVENYVSRLVRDDGTVVWVEESARVVKTGGERYIEGSMKDVSERVETLQALKDSEERFRLFVENSHDGILILDESRRIIYSNRKAAETLGVRSEELIGREFVEFVDPAERRIVVQRFEKRVRGGSAPTSYILTARTAGGERRKLEVRPHVIRNSRGRVRVFVHFLDVTERLMALEALRESEERFRALFESAGDAIFVMEGEVFVQCNETALRMFNCRKRDEILGRSPWEFSPPKQPDGSPSLQKAREYLNAALSGVPQRFYWKHMKRSGELFDAEVSLTRFTSGGKIYTLAIVRDVSEMVKVLQELKHYREELERMVEDRTRRLEEEKKRLAVTLFSIGEGVIVTDHEGRITMMNAAGERLTGWSGEEARGRHVEEVFTILDGRNGEELRNPVRVALEERRVVTIQDNTVLLSRDGSRREIEDSASPILGPDGELWGAVLVFRDVSERKRMEEEMVRSQKLRSLSFLAGGLAHDFNNILTGILASAALARSRAGDDPKLQEALDSLEREAYRARELTDQLLTFTRGGEPLKKVVNIVELVEESATFFLSGSKVRPMFNLPEDLPAVEADPGQIRQVVSNIVQNAKEAMAMGGTIEISGEVVEVGEGSPLPLPKGKYVKISFRDSGVGIPPEALPHIFDPFFSTKAEGRGLGLATCYYIIKNHGGHIEVETEVGRGTTFTVYLPTTEKEAEAKVEKTFELRTGRVLLVDDQEAILETVGELLRVNGYDVEVAREGGEAVRKYEEALKGGRRFDAVIIDLTIPGGMGGKEAIKFLRDLDKNVKAIVSTGYSNDPVVARYREYGFSGVLRKPYRVQELLKTLSEVISGGE